MFINWLLFVRQQVPGLLHKSIQLAWLDVIVSPLRKLYGQFRFVTDDAEFATRHSGIKIYLEKALNDKFDPGVRSIFIDNVDNSARNYVYAKAEGHVSSYVFAKGEVNSLAPLYVKAQYEYLGTNDFIVNVSAAVIFNQGEMEKFINSFKPAGKRFTIITY